MLGTLACRDSNRDRWILRDSTSIAASCAGPIFDGTGVGALRINASVESVRVVCRIVRDTTELGGEGLPTRTLTALIGTDSVAAEIVRDSVWRITITSRGLHTTDSLAVGISLDRLLALPDVHGLTGEGALYVVSGARCGLSFRVTDPTISAPPTSWNINALKSLPRETAVTEILIIGCRPAAKPALL